MALPFRLLAGGPVGGGRQWFPWIHLDDLVAVYRLAIDGRLAGPVNAVAPQQLRQREAARDFGAVLHRPAVVPTPAAAVRLLLGEEADLVLHGQRAVSSKLGDIEFRYGELRPALENALG
jgi:NAD dependent epimerase/dehydratase family enzyme